MKKLVATAVVALALAGVAAPSFAATIVVKHPASTTVIVKHPPHWHQHRVCKTVIHNHRKVTTCTWVNNK